MAHDRFVNLVQSAPISGMRLVVVSLGTIDRRTTLKWLWKSSSFERLGITFANVRESKFANALQFHVYNICKFIGIHEKKLWNSVFFPVRNECLVSFLKQDSVNADNDRLSFVSCRIRFDGMYIVRCYFPFLVFDWLQWLCIVILQIEI